MAYMNRTYGLSESIKDLDVNADRSESDKAYTLGGEVQRGKTVTMNGYMISCLIQRRKAIIFIRNLHTDRDQLISSARNMINGLRAHLRRELGGDYYFHSRVHGIEGVEEWATSEFDIDMLVVMANMSQLTQLRDALVEHDVQPMGAFDESDQILNIKPTHKLVDVSKLIKQCYDLCPVVLKVSATHFATWFTAGDSLTHQHMSIGENPDYKGIESLTHVPIPERNARTSDNIFVQAPDVPVFLDTLVHEEPFDNGHPVVGLIKVSNLISHHHQILEAVRGSPVWSTRLAVVIFNGEGTTLYHDTIRGMDNLVLDRHRSPNRNDVANVGVRMDDGVFQFKTANLTKMLSYMLTHGGVERFPRIVIISGMLASRAQNFTDMDYQLHVTHLLLCVAKTATVVDSIQSLRILGIHKNPTELKLYTTQQIYDDIMKAHNLQKFIVNAAAHNPNQTFVDMCSQVKIHRNKMPGRTICGKRLPLKRVTNERDDNTASFIDVAEPEPESDTHHGDDDIETGLRQVKSAYERQNGIVYRIIQQFVTNGFETLSRTDLNACNPRGLIVLHDYTRWELRHGRFRILEEVTLGRYNLTHQVRQYLQLD